MGRRRFRIANCGGCEIFTSTIYDITLLAGSFNRAKFVFLFSPDSIPLRR
jgi:hypothetical protein